MKRVIALVGIVVVALGGYVLASEPWQATAQGDAKMALNVSWNASDTDAVGDTCTRVQSVGSARDAGYMAVNLPDSIVIANATGAIVHAEPLVGTVVVNSMGSLMCMVSVDIAVAASPAYTIAVGQRVIATIPENGAAGTGDERASVVLLD